MSAIIQRHIGIYDFETMLRGDTFRARDIATLSLDGVPLGIVSAMMQVRVKGGGAVLLAWTCQITGAASNIVTLSARTAEEMQVLPPGLHEYDLEVRFTSDGAKRTIMKGRFPIEADITRTT